jgi:hypothetical protein
MAAGISQIEKILMHIGTAIPRLISHVNFLHNPHQAQIFLLSLAQRMFPLAIKGAPGYPR